MPHVKMNNKPLSSKPKELTEDEKKIQAARAWLQKRNSVAEMVLANLCQGALGNLQDKEDLHNLVDFAMEAADHYMEVAGKFPEAPKE